MQRTGEVCEQCGREFESRNKLFRHLRSDQHREEKGGEDKTDDRDSENVESSVEGHNEKDEERAEGNRKKRVSRAGRVARRRMKNSKNFSEKESSLKSVSHLRRRSDRLTLEDAKAVTQQLGFTPANLIEVGSRHEGSLTPSTVLLYPLNKNEEVKGRYHEGDEKPFPTYIWLTCPLLKARVSKLEDSGLVTVFHQRLLSGRKKDGEQDEDFLKKMEEAHRLYAEERWSKLTPEDAKTVEDKNWVHSLRDVGVAGMRSAGAVKCLHCHYAHYLARPHHENIIGMWTHEALQDLHYDDAADHAEGNDDKTQNDSEIQKYKQARLDGDDIETA